MLLARWIALEWWITLERWMLAMACLWVPVVHADWLSDTHSAMGTEIHVGLWHDNPVQGRRAITEIRKEMRRIDQTYSPWIEASDLARVNAGAAKKPVPLSPEFAFLIDRSLYYSRISGGAFDITFASVGGHYDYREKKQPDGKTRERLLPAVNYRLLQFDPQVPSLGFSDEDLRIDLGGIAKGYAVDRAIEILEKFGVSQATVSAGGDSRVLGQNKDRPWAIGIRNPRKKASDEREVVLTMPLVDTAISTSGDYERFFIDDATGERVHHIINPRTGKSATEAISATVIGPRAIDTDALSTTVFVLGPEKGLELINRLDGFDAVIIDSKGRVRYSAGLTPP